MSETALTNQLNEVNKDEFIKKLKDYEDVNYKIYYKQLEQRLVGYILDFWALWLKENLNVAN